MIQWFSMWFLQSMSWHHQLSECHCVLRWYWVTESCRLIDILPGNIIQIPYIGLKILLIICPGVYMWSSILRVYQSWKLYHAEVNLMCTPHFLYLPTSSGEINLSSRCGTSPYRFNSNISGEFMTLRSISNLVIDFRENIFCVTFFFSINKFAWC